MGHGVVEGEAEDLDEEVDRVTGFVLGGPAPIVLFDDEAWIGRKDKIAGLAWKKLKSEVDQQGRERLEPSGADLFTRPARKRKQRRVDEVFHFFNFESGRKVILFAIMGLEQNTIDLG